VPGSGQENDYDVGFRVITTVDSSRTYKPNTSASDHLHYRPIDIDLWYPADTTASETTVSFADLVHLLEERSNLYDDTRTYDGLTEELLQYICANVNCLDHNVLKRIKTKSHLNATPIKQQFPLIVYLAGFNGMSYENYLLFESLTKKGIVVASVSSIGRYPGNMTMELEDIFEQITDAEFVIRHLTNKDSTSRDIGLIGYSWGGVAATIMAMTQPDRIKAVVSPDGSEQFAYTGEQEDEKLNRIREANFFKPEVIKASFLYLDSDISEADNSPDSIYNITDHVRADSYYLKIDHAAHEDFSSLSIVSQENDSNARYYVIEKLAVDYMVYKLKGKNTFLGNIPTEGITKQFSSSKVKVDLGPIGRKVLRGTITDKKSNLPLPYVNIGIPGKDIGTTSNTKGEFELSLMESNANDTLKISMIGYQSRVIYLKDVLTRQKQSLNIELQEKSHELKEIVVTDKMLKTKVLGNKTESKFFGGKFASGDLGSEIAIRINIKGSPSYLDIFTFNISYNSGDTATFRVNIYEIKNGLPDKNLLTENVLARINGQTGKINIDLSKYNTVVMDDFFIGLEWIEGKNNSGIVFSSGFVNNGTYYRKASQGRWKKYPMGVGFNVTAKY
jgi:pimeloyl-ACP methyl ester carboxylesterase